jgi:succinate-semialdehyde dehydrogenase/glutarate-semialdehyde dehydrogenase
MNQQLISTNPSRGYETIGSVGVSSLKDIRSAVAAAHRAKAQWKEMGVEARAKLLRRVISKFSTRSEEMATLIAQEMGMPIREARDDVGFALNYLEAYCDQAQTNLLPKVTFENEHEVHTVYQVPLGVVACIVPWNFPMGNFVWQCGQNLIAGNTVIFKTSEETPLSGKLIEEIVNSVLPDGVFTEVYGGAEVGRELISQDIDAVCFTGSSTAGKAISKAVADRLLPTNMELGGSAPGIVFEDADIEAVIDTLYSAHFLNNGQVCDGLKRLIVHESQIDEVLSRLQSIVTQKHIGDAMNDKTDLGPLAAKRQLELLEAQVRDAVDKGAHIVCGGKRPEGLEGAYYEPTIITQATQDMRVWQEEVFGPVLPAVSFQTEAEAVALANDTQYGLGGYIFTSDNSKFERTAMALNTCMISQNILSYVKPQNFFGGCKMSGHGREHAEFGLSEVTTTKLIAKQKVRL